MAVHKAVYTGSIACFKDFAYFTTEKQVEAFEIVVTQGELVVAFRTSFIGSGEELDFTVFNC